MNVIDSYENYREEKHLNSLKSKQIIFITNIRALDNILDETGRVLDCGAGNQSY